MGSHSRTLFSFKFVPIHPPFGCTKSGFHDMSDVRTMKQSLNDSKRSLRSPVYRGQEDDALPRTLIELR